jgi:molybdopterin synthase catalytic subunit
MITTATQSEPFDTGAIAAALSAERHDIGAVVTFTGHVRADDGLTALVLEHYPAMTDRQMAAIAAEAWARWPLLGGTVVHRHGRLLPGEAIVVVAVASAHRGAAFEAASFLMDWLKTRAPFWKREEHGDTGRWVAAKASDDDAAARWDAPA